MLSESDRVLKAGFRRADGLHRWKEMYELFPTLSELQSAKANGFVGYEGLKDKIKSGDSFLFPAP